MYHMIDVPRVLTKLKKIYISRIGAQMTRSGHTDLA